MTAQRSAPTAAPEASRKSWTPKTPIEVVLEQITKQEKRVAAMRDELVHEERELAKLTQARKVLEAQ